MGYLLPIIAELIRDYRAADILGTHTLTHSQTRTSLTLRLPHRPGSRDGRVSSATFRVDVLRALPIRGARGVEVCALTVPPRPAHLGDSPHRSDWFECVQKIAVKVPVLISKKEYYFKQMELEMEALLVNGFTDRDYHDQQKARA